MTERDGAAAGLASGRRPGLIAVVGSANVDLIATVEARPEPGETLLATDYVENAGGKGLNQAVATARVAPVALVALVGPDDAGDLLRDHASERGVDVSAVGRAQVPTGRAFITLLPDGDNTIVVAALANAALEAEHVRHELERLQPAVVMLQFEIPDAAVEAAVEWAASAGARVLVNPSPVRRVSSAVLRAADPLLVNLGEARAVAPDLEVQDAERLSPLDLAAALASRCRSVVITLGADGAVLAGNGSTATVPVSQQVTVRDSSGAGDEFAGRLAAGLAHGDALEVSARAAVDAASRLVGLTRAER